MDGVRREVHLGLWPGRKSTPHFLGGRGLEPSWDDKPTMPSDPVEARLGWGADETTLRWMEAVVQRTWDLRWDNPTKGGGKGKGKGKGKEAEDKEDEVESGRGGSSKFRLQKDKDPKGKGKEEEAKDELKD